MKCQSNKIGEWLDNAYTPAESGDYRAKYDGAMEVLKVAGFQINCVPCGRGMIHVVNPPDRIIKADGSECQLKLEV